MRILLYFYTLHCVGKKVVRGLYTYEPSVIADDTENDLKFNKDDFMVVITEYVRPSVCLCVCVCVRVCFFITSACMSHAHSRPTQTVVSDSRGLFCEGAGLEIRTVLLFLEMTASRFERISLSLCN